MTIYLRFLWVLTLLTVGSISIPAAPAGTNQPAGLRLTVELQDGSRIIGKNGDDTFQFRSEVLGEMKLPLERIRSIECQPKTNSVQLTTANGDTLTAQFLTKVVRLETVFGSVKLPVNLIRHLTVSSAGKPGQMREGLVSLWSGEGNGDDSVGANRGTLLNGASFAGGEVGQAFSFSGGDDGVPNPCIQIPFSPTLTTPNFSVETWINAAGQINNPDNQAVIFGESYGFTQMVVRPGSTGVRVVFQIATSPSKFLEVAGTTEIPIGRFSHAAGTWDGTTLRLYLNGVLSAQKILHVQPVASGCPFYIGGFYTSSADECKTVSQFFNGLIDEVSFYNRALSAPEIQADYEAGNSSN